ncbi:histidine kinase dimerization/phosphoacceptor domain -containing protein [Catalinimonas niigatensis]|uniref:histidine kinase dimerization/phosphoacceptor domain -containing protein n=1 Tax=Catalinimonas niigatensis TaxID=1397264 RepID=UPI0026656A10|nr:histidine kinase dimerization/phosphoacceptor domain -containing protein [Catalinimonas niigatensis]WPP52801.1 histidine kinase dimerization/phosphoacceptor domain -containing protein [Catalinimonas niigatensis]
MKESKQPQKVPVKISSFKNELENFSAFQALHMLKQNISDCYCITDEEGFIVDVNEKFCRTLEYQENELLGKKISDLLSSEIRPYALMLHHEYIWERSHENQADWPYQTKSENTILLHSTTTRLLTSEHRRFKLEVLYLQPSQPSKEPQQDKVIRKIQHQFKNTLHEVSGLLHLQAAPLQGEAREAILLAHLRITAISIAFELLYKSTQPENINLAEYVSKLTDKYRQDFEIQIEHDTLHWPVDKTYALGIILVEFLSSGKDKRMPKQQLKIEGKNLQSHYHLKIRGNDCFSPVLSHFSNQLIQALGKQLQAKLEIQNHDNVGLSIACRL